ncbi:MAG: hypothetical protein EOM20_18875 [Spartobacteria bacterium]|nr:hypothetical protein [Spartobacteria bacterium]
MKAVAVILVVWACWVGTGWAVEPYVDFREWRRLSNRDVSRLGNNLLKQADGERLHAESEHFIAHGDDKEAIDRALRKAEVAWMEAGQALRLMPTRKKAHVYILDNAAWTDFTRKYRLLPDARAFAYKGEIFITDDAATDQTFRDDVLHEVVHYRLTYAYRDKLPLAVEEGLAQYIGWQITRGYYSFHGQRLERRRPPLHPDKLYPLNELLQMDAYPSDAAAMEVFNRQSEALIAAIVGLIDEDNLGPFIKTLSRGGRPWSQILQEQFDCTPEQLSALEAETAALAMETDR